MLIYKLWRLAGGIQEDSKRIETPDITAQLPLIVQPNGDANIVLASLVEKCIL